MSYLNAAYTITLHDALIIYPDLLSDIVLSTEDRTNNLIKHIESNWGIYELAGETIQEFKLFIKYRFEEYSEYYEKLLNAFESEIDVLAGDVEDYENVLKNKGWTIYKPRAITSVTYQQGTGVTETITDLPRSTPTEEHPRMKTNTQRTGTDTQTSTGVSGENTTDRDYTNEFTSTKKRGNPVDLLDNYFKKLRDIYDDFAKRFKSCFIQLFD